MENFIITINTFLPIFYIAAVGLLVQRTGMLSKTEVRQANNMCVNVFTTTLLFRNIYVSDLSTAFNGKLLIFCFLGMITEFIVGLVLFTRTIPERPTRGVMLQAFFRVNTVVIGIPIATALFGPEHVGQVTVILALIDPFANVLSVVTLEMQRSNKLDFRWIVRSILLNPFIISATLGLLMLFFQLKLPSTVEVAVNNLADATVPLSIVLMGAALDFSKFKTSVRNLSFAVVCRLIINPTVFLTLAVALGFRGVALCAVLGVFAAPVAVNSHTLALQMDGDADLAGSIVLVSTGVSCITLCIWIWLLKGLCLM